VDGAGLQFCAEFRAERCFRAPHPQKEGPGHSVVLVLRKEGFEAFHPNRRRFCLAMSRLLLEWRGL